MASNPFVRVVFGRPDKIKEIRNISPLCGKVVLRFRDNDMATCQVFNGPEFILEDKGDHWLIHNEYKKVTAIQMAIRRARFAIRRMRYAYAHRNRNTNPD